MDINFYNSTKNKKVIFYILQLYLEQNLQFITRVPSPPYWSSEMGEFYRKISRLNGLLDWFCGCGLDKPRNAGVQTKPIDPIITNFRLKDKNHLDTL